MIKTTQEIYDGAHINYNVVQNNGGERWIKVNDVIKFINKLKEDFDKDIKPCKCGCEHDAFKIIDKRASEEITAKTGKSEEGTNVSK